MTSGSKHRGCTSKRLRCVLIAQPLLFTTPLIGSAGIVLGWTTSRALPVPFLWLNNSKGLKPPDVTRQTFIHNWIHSVSFISSLVSFGTTRLLFIPFFFSIIIFSGSYAASNNFLTHLTSTKSQIKNKQTNFSVEKLFRSGSIAPPTDPEADKWS